MSEQSFVSVYQIYSVNTDSILCEYTMCSSLLAHKRDDIRLTICVFYLWETSLNVGLNTSFNSMQA
jgi:hypothetical protein